MMTSMPGVSSFKPYDGGGGGGVLPVGLSYVLILGLISATTFAVSASGPHQPVDKAGKETKDENTHRDEYHVPPLPADWPFPPFLHERDVIRHMDSIQRFLKVGGGAHAQISLAEIRGGRPNQLVVVKTFRDSSFSHIVSESRIHRYLESLNVTPRLIGVLPSGPKSSNLSLVFEFIPYSHSLHDWMTPEHRSSLTTGQWLDVALQLIRVIRLVHSYDVIFNDLHRGNVVIQKKGDYFRVFIIDFGLATFKTGKRYSNDYGSLQGYTFIAPEAKYQRQTTKMSDVYSIGIMLRKMSVKLGIPKLLPLSQWCSARQPEDRPSLDMIERRLRDLFLEEWIVSLRRSWPNQLSFGSYHFNAFDGKAVRLNICESEGAGSVDQAYDESGKRLPGVKRAAEEPPIWTWLTENNPRVFTRCPGDVFLLDFHEVLFDRYHQLLHTSDTQSIIFTGMESDDRMVVLKQFHDVAFSVIREEACVTAFLGKLGGITPHVFGILPGPRDTDLSEAAIVQEYYGEGITLATYVDRVKFTHWDLTLLKAAATLPSFEDEIARRKHPDRCKLKKIDDFLGMLKIMKRRYVDVCPKKSPKEKLYGKVAMFLTRAMTLVHSHGFLINNFNKHNVLVRWSDTSDSLEANLVDLGRVTSLNGLVMGSKPSYLSGFPFLAPEVVQGGRSSVKSDVFSLCHLIRWLFDEFTSDGEWEIRNGNPENLRGWSAKGGSSFDSKITSNNRWSKSGKVNQSGHCLPGRCPQREHPDTDRWQCLQSMLSRCLSTETVSRPSLKEILETLAYHLAL